MELLTKLAKHTVKGFYEVRAPTMASSISFFAMTTVAPLGVLALWLGNLLLGPSSASGVVGSALRSALGPKLGAAMLTLIAGESHKNAGQIAGVISILLLLYGAGSLFLAVQHALNVVWRVRIAPHTDLGRHVALRAGIVFSTMFLPAVVLLISTVARNVFVSLVTTPTSPHPLVITVGWQLLVIVGSFLLVALLFAILPDAKMALGPIALGSGFTAVTWTLGTWAMGLYMSNVALVSRYGAAGALMVLLLWLFLMAQLLLAGARLSYEYANLIGKPPTPRPWAERYEKEQVSRADAQAHTAKADLDHA